jgi:hypothetical protein
VFENVVFSDAFLFGLSGSSGIFPLSSSSVSSVEGKSDKASVLCVLAGVSGRKIELTKVVFRSCVAKKSLSGGCVSFGDSCSRLLKMTDCEFYSCECNTTEGKGGALSLSFQTSTPQLSATDLKFYEEGVANNNAFIGRDMYLLCLDLTTFGIAGKFPFHTAVATGNRGNSLFGHDSTHYPTPVNLFIFITGYSGEIVYVGSKGGDTEYCGIRVFPCLTINKGVKRFKVTDNNVITIAESGAVDESLDLSFSSLTSSSTSLSVLSVDNSLSKILSYALFNSGSITQNLIDFSFPSSLGGSISALILSSGGVLTIESCVFTHTGPNPIVFSLVCVTGGEVTRTNITVYPVVKQTFSSSVSPFMLTIGGVMSVERSRFGNVEMSLGSLFSVDSEEASFEWSEATV